MRIYHPLGRWSRPLAALAALAATLLLGLLGPALPGPRSLFGWGGLGLLLTGGAGLLAAHLARLSATPSGRSGLAGAALPAAMLALAVPQLGAAALLVPCALALAAAWRDSQQRSVALAVLCGALALLAGPVLGALASAAIPAIAWFSMRAAAFPAANDNPSLERLGDIWPLRRRTTHANPAGLDSDSGVWGVA